MAKATVRVELTRAQLAKRGLITIVVVALALLLLSVRSAGIVGGPDQISAQLVNAGGSLAKGADVKLRGVLVGRVQRIQAGPTGGVRVRLGMKPGQLPHIPSNVVARILPATVFGTSFVDLTTHGVSSGKALRAGAVVPQDPSQETLELQRALDDIDTLVKALNPAQLSVTLGAAAMALDGRGKQIGDTLDLLDRYLTRAQPKLPLLRSDVAKLATNLELVRRIAPDALTAVQDSLVTMHTVVAEKATIASLLTGGTRLIADSNAFLAKERPDLVRFLNSTAIVTDVYYDLRHQAFTEAFATLRFVAARLGTTIHHGWLDNDVVIQQGIPAYYGSADCPRFGAAKGNNCTGLGRAGVGAMLGGTGTR